MDAGKVVVAILAIGIGSLMAQAAEGGGATFQHVQKQVQVGNKLAIVGAKAPAGTVLSTQANSRAELKMPNGAVARIGQGSNFVFDSHKMTLSKGSGLFKGAGSTTTVVTPSLNCGTGSGVLSVHASKGYEACFILDGKGTVNGQPLIAGEALVKEKGVTHKIVFDVQRLLQTSSLVSKFPQTPWVKETFAVAAVQHELATQSAVIAHNHTKAASGATSASTNNVANSALVALQSRGVVARNAGNLIVAFGNGAEGRLTNGAITINNSSSLTLNSTIRGGTNLFAANRGGNGGALIVGGGSGGVSGATLNLGNPGLQPSGGSLILSSTTSGVGVQSSAGVVNTTISGATLNMSPVVVSSGALILHGTTPQLIRNSDGTFQVINNSGNIVKIVGQPSH